MRRLSSKIHPSYLAAFGVLLLTGVLSSACGNDPVAPPTTPTPVTPTVATPAPPPANRSPIISDVAVSPTGVALVAATRVTFSANANDPDGDALTYDWNFGDGASAANAGPVVDHVFGSAGTLAVAVTVTDAHGASATLHTPVTGVTMTGTWRGCALSGTGIQTFEINQNGSAVGGTYKVPTLQVPISGTLSHPRHMLILIFDGQLQPWTLDATGNTIIWTSNCMMTRQ